jgi:hypothetical protein
MKALAQARIWPKAVLLLAVAGLGLASCESPPAAPPPVAEAPPPPPPAVALPSAIVQNASVYRAYVERAAAIRPDFTNGESIASALRSAEAYEHHQLQQGETAYAAVIALQDPTFVASVRGFAADPAQRASVADAIMKDPAYAAGFKGADSAAGLIIAALTDQGARVLDAGHKVKQAAYDVQHQAWSKDFVPNRPERLAEAKTLSNTQLKAAIDDAAQMQQASSGAAPMGLTPARADPPYTPLVVRALAVAAMAALGEGGEANSDQLSALLVESNQTMCLSMAKLNLYQCLAVSKPHYEDVFCLGQHILMDTGQCILNGARPGGAALQAKAALSPMPPSATR